MSIAHGTRLGNFDVIALIGTGGMGEVYKARDTRLDRIVAIKVLPAHLADKPELRERFEREARTIASLNHPHICTLYDIGRQDGTDFLVMEYMEGETLATRLLKGPLPLEQVLQYAIEISDALDKAHRKGVTHRDIKPGNVMLTKSGTKLLDFGLAKLKQAAIPAAMPESQMATLSRNPTIEGTLLGTIQYMAPEQVEGKNDEIDGRTDIFAFGTLVYEMATGKKAFEGKTNASVMSKIMQVDPPPMSSLQPVTPPGLEHVVKTCLAKDPEDRWQTARDVTRELKSIAEGGSQVGIPVAVAARHQRQLGWIAAAVLLLGLASLAFVHYREAPRVIGLETRTEIVTPSSTDLISIAFSPDGRQIVFVASVDGAARLWLRRLDATASQPLPGTEGANYPFWSPDGRSVGFIADGKLKRIDVGGGSPRTVIDTASRGGTWNADGTILFARSAAGPLSRVSASGGEPVEVTKLGKQTSHRFPQFLPGGRQFLFYATGTLETAGIYLGSLDSPETKRLAAADTAGVYSSNGWLLYVRAGMLLAQRLDLGRGELVGDPVTVANSVAFDAAANVGAFSVSAAGLVIYRSGGSSQRQLVWFDRSGKTLGTLGVPDTSNLLAPRLSPDGRRAALYRLVQGNWDIWLLDAARATRFTFDAAPDRYPIWSPDGSRIAFDSNRKGHRDLYLKPLNGAGSEELLLESAQDKVAMDWSRDGRSLLYLAIDPQTSFDIWVLPMEGERKPYVFVKTLFVEGAAQFSPDAHWVSYMSNESGQYEIYVRSFSDTSREAAAGGQWQVSTAGGTYPRWSADGKELFYVAPNGKLMAVPITARGPTFQSGGPVALFQTRIYTPADALAGFQYDVSRDGRFLMNTVLEDSNVPITLIQNWNPEAKK
jgi:eukaryotic-like serine/threonine-protein kinase